MDALLDALAAVELPEEWRRRQLIVDGIQEITTGPVIEAPGTTKSHKELLSQFGYDPDEFEIVGTINQWRKERPDGSFLVSYFFKARQKSVSLDLPALTAAASRKRRPARPKSTSGRTTVIGISDAQIGKVGHRGGTPELLDRLADKYADLRNELKTRKPEDVILLEGGDLFENFESGGNPMFTNDLSLSQQMDLAGEIVYEFASIACEFGPTTVGAVTSNHTAWRRGKQELGRPQDDLGLFVHKQAAKLAKAAGLPATWVIPADFSDSIIIETRGFRIGLTHGHRAGSQTKIINWWMGQQHGGQPVGAADMLVYGHWHHLHLEPTGRNPYTNKTKWILGLPTLDNGSDWFRGISGDDSDPGLVVFDITDDGFDLKSFTVL